MCLCVEANKRQTTMAMLFFSLSPRAGTTQATICPNAFMRETCLALSCIRTINGTLCLSLPPSLSRFSHARSCGASLPRLAARGVGEQSVFAVLWSIGSTRLPCAHARGNARSLPSEQFSKRNGRFRSLKILVGGCEVRLRECRYLLERR